ncbi:hypothetical protein BX600DRAFT_428852 [Xylariales sp. PMI_506]|nr:hypothetical protein BX600DRAFT_428852 [Xylariales sp. PMI_506]
MGWNTLYSLVSPCTLGHEYISPWPQTDDGLPVSKWRLSLKSSVSGPALAVTRNRGGKLTAFIYANCSAVAVGAGPSIDFPGGFQASPRVDQLCDTSHIMCVLHVYETSRELKKCRSLKFSFEQGCADARGSWSVDFLARGAHWPLWDPNIEPVGVAPARSGERTLERQGKINIPYISHPS